MDRFGLAVPPPVSNRAEVRPTDAGLIVDRTGALLMPWGLVAPWDGRSLINARAESLPDKPTFRPLLANRCLVPASAWFEWRAASGGKLKNRFARSDGGILALAGLHDGERFTIITCAAAGGLERIHDRMPVALDEAMEREWIDPERPFAEVADLLAPYPAENLSVEEEIPAGYQSDLFG